MPAIPSQVGPYRVLRPLGAGGMGAVYLAEDVRLHRHVALKVFSGAHAASDYARDQLLREARAAAALNHARIATVHDVLDSDGQVVIVFEYVEGDTLADRLARGKMTAAAAIDIAVQLADALSVAHLHGIIHRDLKPSNIVITSDGGVKVLDFGVARIDADAANDAEGARTTAGAFVGTVGYASPEQCLGQAVDARADIFSLGVVLFEMLTGARPFPGTSRATVMRAMLSGAVVTPFSGRRIPSQVDPLLRRMLAPEPDDRPASAHEVREALRAIVVANPRLVRPPRRLWVPAALALTTLAILALVGSLFLSQQTEAPAGAKAPVVAVMPLTNASGDASKDYLAVGMADSLVTRLAAIPSITVLSRTAVADLRRAREDVRGIAGELDAAYLVDGTVQQSGDTLRISLSLVGRDGTVVWADTAQGAFASVFDLQSRIASSLAQALSIRLSAAERALLAAQPTSSAQALEAYWRGRALLEAPEVTTNVDAAIEAFESAIRLDPRFAEAHAGRGEALWSRYVSRRDKRDADEAIAAGTTALRLNPSSAMVRYSLALSLGGSGRLDEAVEELQHALAIQPNFDAARRELGLVLARQGKVDEAVQEFRKAIALRPNYWRHHSALGLELFRAARYREAEDAFRAAITLQPENVMGYQQLGAVLQTVGRDDEALENYQRAIAIQPSAPAYSNIGILQYRRGDYASAADAFRQAIKLRPSVHISHGNLGDALRRLGEREEARSAYRDALRLAQQELSVNPKDAGATAALAMYAAKAGDRNVSLQHLQRLDRQENVEPRSLATAAIAAVTLGDHDRALSLIDRAVARGYSRVIVAQTDEFEPLRKLPRFVAMTQTDAQGAPSR